MTDLKKAVGDWLQTSGYPLEMIVAQGLQHAGFGVVQSEYYEDAHTGKWRECDVMAYEQHYGKTVRAIFSLVVECKSGVEKPWILFTRTDPYPRQLSVSRRATTEAGQSVLGILSLNDEIGKSPLFAVPERPGYGLTVAFRNSSQQDSAYEALQEVCGATVGILNRHSKIASELIIPFVWPVIVIGSPLLECYLHADGSIRTEECEKGILIWRNPLVTRHTIVQIYTRRKFLEEVRDYRSAVLTFLEAATIEHDRSPRLKLPGNA
jgi:hypothetical protein